MLLCVMYFFMPFEERVVYFPLCIKLIYLPTSVLSVRWAGLSLSFAIYDPEDSFYFYFFK